MVEFQISNLTVAGSSPVFRLMKKEKMLFILEWIYKSLTFTRYRNRELEKDIEDLIRDIKKDTKDC